MTAALPTARLAALGQSLWLDNITRTLLDSGTLARYIRELSVTGLTSNPTIFEKAIGSGTTYDAQVAELAAKGHSVEEIFFACAIAEGMDLVPALRFANAGAGLSTTRIGTAPAMARRAEIDAKLATWR